jgi:hypothetical protein
MSCPAWHSVPRGLPQNWGAPKWEKLFLCIYKRRIGGSDAMASSKDMPNSKRKALSRLFPALAAAAEHGRTAARLETLEIMMDVEQISDLLTSFEDLRQGRIVNMNNAFGDL